MNYVFKIAHTQNINISGEFTVIGTEIIDEAFRPQVGQELRLRKATGLWKVVRVEPVDNPTGRSNTYFIEKIHR